MSQAARDRAILAAAVLLALVAGALTSRLAIKSDLSYLLPESTPSVRQLRAIEKRARVAATFMIGVESDDPAGRARAGDDASAPDSGPGRGGAAHRRDHGRRRRGARVHLGQPIPVRLPRGSDGGPRRPARAGDESQPALRVAGRVKAGEAGATRSTPSGAGWTKRGTRRTPPARWFRPTAGCSSSSCERTSTAATWIVAPG